MAKNFSKKGKEFFLKQSIIKYSIFIAGLLCLFLLFWQKVFYRMPELTEKEMLLMLKEEEFRKTKEKNLIKKNLNDENDQMNKISWSKIEIKEKNLVFFYPKSKDIFLNFDRVQYLVDYFTFPSQPIFSLDLNFGDWNKDSLFLKQSQKGLIIFSLFPKGAKKDIYWVNKVLMHSPEEKISRLKILDKKGIIIENAFGIPENLLILIFGDRHIYWWELRFKNKDNSGFFKDIFIKMVTNFKYF